MRTAHTTASSVSFRHGRRPRSSASSTTRGGIDETRIRLLEGPSQPLRQSSQAVRDDPTGLDGGGVLQEARSGARHAVPDADQPLPAGLRRERPEAGSEVEAGSPRAQPNKRLKLAGDNHFKGSGVVVPLAGHRLRPATLRRRAGRPQLKRDPLGAPRNSQMHHSLRRFSSAWVVALSACAPSAAVPLPAFRYPDLLWQAGIQGPVRFRVRLDSTGSPQLTTFQVVATPNPGFPPAVRNALKGWRDSSRAGHIVDQTVLFVIMDSAGTDSLTRCRSSRRDWTVCARRARTTTLRVY